MPSAMSCVLRAAGRRDGEPLRVLSFPTHERYQSGLAGTAAHYYLVRGPQVKDWNRQYAPLPANHTLLDPALGPRQIPADLEVDLVLSQNKAGQFQIASRLSALLHVPLVSLEHTLPHPSWPAGQLDAFRSLRGHVDVFISEFSRSAWGMPGAVIHHGIDTETFRPLECQRQRHVLSVVNDFRTPQRHWCCGFPFWEEAVRGLPWEHLGSDPSGWSRPAADAAALNLAYNRCAVFVDTASASPVPTVVLEAMAAGAVVCSRGNAMVPEIITDGVNGFLCPDVASMRARLLQVLDDPHGFEDLRRRARETVLKRFSLSRFVSDWDALLRRAADTPYTGAP